MVLSYLVSDSGMIKIWNITSGIITSGILHGVGARESSQALDGFAYI